MLYAWIDGVKRPPCQKGERTICRDCGGIVTSVMPVENVNHWRHRVGDCDPWSEPEGEWHLKWKERFDLACREINLVDSSTGEHHRADVLCGLGTERSTVLELQHSSISEDERVAREAYYQKEHRMLWLVHVHNENSFAGFNFGISLDFTSRSHDIDGKHFAVMEWMGTSKQFIEKWKRSTAHVFFDWNGALFFLAGQKLSKRLGNGSPFNKGEFALCQLTLDDFIRAVHWADLSV